MRLLLLCLGLFELELCKIHEWKLYASEEIAIFMVTTTTRHVITSCLLFNATPRWMDGKPYENSPTGFRVINLFIAYLLLTSSYSPNR